MARNSRGSVDIVSGRIPRTQSVFVVVWVARIGAADALIGTKFAIVPSSSLIHKGMFLGTMDSSFYCILAMSRSRSRRPNRVVRRIFHSDTRTILVSVVVYGVVVPRRFSVSKGISSHGVHRRVARNGFVSPALLVSFFEQGKDDEAGRHNGGCGYRKGLCRREARGYSSGRCWRRCGRWDRVHRVDKDPGGPVQFAVVQIHRVVEAICRKWQDKQSVVQFILGHVDFVGFVHHPLIVGDFDR